mmetsp:Transcript_14247/g.29250  ORF Transcript_14247/g.29250 Transcript_14247/m.29250 type:complete len:124 (+) Transcript_14247:3-374(+)
MAQIAPSASKFGPNDLSDPTVVVSILDAKFEHYINECQALLQELRAEDVVKLENHLGEDDDTLKKDIEGEETANIEGIWRRHAHEAVVDRLQKSREQEKEKERKFIGRLKRVRDKEGVICRRL